VVLQVHLVLLVAVVAPERQDLEVPPVQLALPARLVPVDHKDLLERLDQVELLES